MNWLFKLFRQKTKSKPQKQNFVYAYKRYPFDDCQYFSVEAENIETADIEAKKIYEEMLNSKQTVMIDFYRSPKQP